ncbi:MAG: hypothetical protein ACI4ES_08045 [Roseburia sp.]
MKQRKTIFLSIGVGLLVVILLIVLVPFLFFKGTTDVDKYGEFETYCGYSELKIFPKELDEEAEEVSYYYWAKDTFLDPTCEIYLKCTYPEQRFEEEVARVKGITGIREDTEHFQYPAYVAMYNFSSSYEYALVLEEEKSIVYVNTQGIYPNWFLGLRFPKEYLPEDFMEDITYTGNPEVNFTIY